MVKNALRTLTGLAIVPRRTAFALVRVLVSCARACLQRFPFFPSLLRAQQGPHRRRKSLQNAACLWVPSREGTQGPHTGAKLLEPVVLGRQKYRGCEASISMQIAPS